MEQHAAKAPTCTEIGWNAYETCSRCDHTTYAELPALNHDLEQHEAKAPTCTGIGWDAYDTCSRCDYTTYAELPALNHDLVQHDAKAPTCTEIGWDAYDTCSRCDYNTYQELPISGHNYQAVTMGGETLTFCPVCGQVESGEPLKKIEAATAWAISGNLFAADVIVRINGEYLSVAFESAGSLTKPTGLVRIALPAELLEGKKLMHIAPDGTQTEMPFETKNGKIIFTLDFANSELPVMLFRLAPQTTTL